MEPFAGERVAAGLKELGVDVRTDTGTTSVTRGDDGVSIVLDDGSTVTATEVLVATGRSPRSGDIGLDVVGLEADDVEADVAAARRAPRGHEHLGRRDRRSVVEHDRDAVVAARDARGAGVCAHVDAELLQPCRDPLAREGLHRPQQTAAGDDCLLYTSPSPRDS